MAAAALVTGSLLATSVFAANNTFGIDEINWTDEDWACIAMTNDDTVETGAVIRTEANADSKAAGYLYRGAAAKVVDKGEEWTLVESGRVTGYVKNEFLSFGADARGLAAHYGEQGVVANWNDVSVYSLSDGASPVAGTVNDGSVLGMVQDNGHWIAVQQGKDSAGYVSEEDVTRVLLVDTAVPAEGEDDEDVVVTMTAEELPTAGKAAAPAEEVYEETSYEEETSRDEYEDYSEETYTAAPEEDYTKVSIVSDDPTIQALYEAYMAAQNAAMNCTSKEDAEQKAAAAVAAWNAYVAACNGTPVAETSSANASAAAADTSNAADADSDDDEDLYAEDDDTYDDDSYEDDSYDDDSYEDGDDDDGDDEWVDVDAADDEEDDTTSDAVAAASSNTSGLYGGASDLDLLAAIIWCEAGNQPYDGMVAVGQVVMNRVKSSSFPNTIAEVLNSPGQFTPSSSGTLQAAINAGVNETCYAAASDALNGASPVPGTPLYFNTHSGSYKLGAHYFS